MLWCLHLAIQRVRAAVLACVVVVYGFEGYFFDADIFRQLLRRVVNENRYRVFTIDLKPKNNARTGTTRELQKISGAHHG